MVTLTSKLNLQVTYLGVICYRAFAGTRGAAGAEAMAAAWDAFGVSGAQREFVYGPSGHLILVDFGSSIPPDPGHRSNANTRRSGAERDGFVCDPDVYFLRRSPGPNVRGACTSLPTWVPDTPDAAVPSPIAPRNSAATPPRPLTHGCRVELRIRGASA